MAKKIPDKDPDSVEPYFKVWCDSTGTNTSGDNGELQGATISTSTWAIAPTGSLTEDSENTSAVTIDAIAYGVNTVATIWLSGGIPGQTYKLTNTITTSDSQTLPASFTLLVKESHA